LRFDSSSAINNVRRLRLALLAVVVLAAAACSTIRFGYNNADIVIVHTLSRYVTLTSEQEQVVRERMAAVLAWHRGTQLTDYAAFVQRARVSIDGNVTAGEVLEFNEGLNARLAALGEHIAPDAAALAATLTPEQIDQIERKLSGDNAKARKESAQELKQAVDERIKKYAERAEFWFGRLTPAQVEIVRSSFANRPVDSLYWIEARERRTHYLIALLRRIHSERPDQETAARWFRAYFAELARPSNTQQRARANAFRRDNALLVAQLLNSATPEQHAHLDKRLSGFAAEFTQLAAHRGSAG
jgi:hypothetical protein